MRTKEYLALLRVRDERLTLTTMRFHDEVRPAKHIPTPTRKSKPSPQQLDQAIGLIEALACPWDPSRYEDRYERRLERIVERKRKAQTIKPPSATSNPGPSQT
jgi:DNA end-binding protein Ku